MGSAMTGRFTRSVAVILIVGWGTVCSGKIAAQGREPPAPAQTFPRRVISVKQMALTEAQVRGVLAAANSIYDITDNAPEDIDKLSPETVAKLDAVASKNGFASYDEYKIVRQNIGLVSAGIDPVTHKYVGREAVIRTQISRARADKKMSPEDRKERLTELNTQLQFALPPVKHKRNIDLVLKYSSSLSEVSRGD